MHTHTQPSTLFSSVCFVQLPLVMLAELLLKVILMYGRSRPNNQS